MRLRTIARGFTLDNRTEGLMEKKLSRLDKYFDADTEALITMILEKNQKRIEVTIPYKGFTLRAERASKEFLDALDEAMDILERQIRKNRTRLEKRFKSGALDFTADEEDEADAIIVKTKKFSAKPMDTEEAILQMEMIGHNFFVFVNSETENVNVLYKRNDGNYGLMEPEFD